MSCMPSDVEDHYKKWINRPTLFDNPLDVVRFYKFVKACIHFCRFPISGSWLRGHLENNGDLENKYGKDYSDKQIDYAVLLFNHLIDFNKTPM